MNRLFEFLRNNRIASITAGLAFLVFLLLLVLLFRSPRFPESKPETDLNRKNFLQERQALFQQFSDYLRDKHGELLLSELLSPRPATKDSADKKPGIVTFRQQYRVLNQSLIAELAQDFAAKQGMRTAIRLGCQTYKTDSTCHELDFLKGEVVWMRVLLESKPPIYPEKGKRSEYLDSLDGNGQTIITKSTEGSGRLAIIIDDLGYRMDVFNDLITLDYNITYAVLPQQAYSRETADIASQAGRQVILHLPMQPRDWPRFDPGLGALLLRDTPEEIKAKITRNLDTVPHVSGVNNHMGSAYTQYEDGLDILMTALNKNELFFLDSKTAPGRAAKQAAARHQVPYLSRDVFLDNDRDEELILKQLRKAIRLAKKRGWAIAIGHPYEITYTVLARQLPKIEEQGVRIIKVVDLLN